MSHYVLGLEGGIDGFKVGDISLNVSQSLDVPSIETR